MRSVCALLAAAALGLSYGVDTFAQAQAIPCTYTPTGYTADQVSYDLTGFKNMNIFLDDERNQADPFNYYVAICHDINPNFDVVPASCVTTRSMTSQTNCSQGSEGTAMAFQYYKNDAGPSPGPSPAPPAREAQVDTPEDASARAAAVAAGITTVKTGRVLHGELRDSIVADAQKAISQQATADESMTVAINPLTAGVDAAPTCNSDRCWRVAGQFNAANFAIGNISHRGPSGVDTHHLASGVTVSMAGGDSCYDAGAGAGTGTAGLFPRSMDIHLICSPQFGALKNDALVVEVTTCKYEVVVHTVHACPVQCLQDASSGGTDLCGAASRGEAGNTLPDPAKPKGVCNFDTGANQARCFCFDGWSGPHCTQSGDLGAPTPTGHPEQIVGGLFGGLVGGLVLAGGVFYYMVYVYTGSAGGGGSTFEASAPAPASSGVAGGIRSMFGGSSGAYAPPTPEGGAIPGIDDAGAGYDAPGGDDDDNPML